MTILYNEQGVRLREADDLGSDDALQVAAVEEVAGMQRSSPTLASCSRYGRTLLRLGRVQATHNALHLSNCAVR